MEAALLEVRDLWVSAGENAILKGLSLSIRPGETHVLMGQNGAGKSTLGAAIMGNPAFTVESGELLFDGEDIKEESPDERARKGIFLSFQNPQEVPGISLENFLRTAKGAVQGEVPRVLNFRKELRQRMGELEMAGEYAGRELNVGFSGGEKKKSEVLQMLTLNPKLAILDETDSGLDVDAVHTVSAGVKRFRNKNNALLIITHNAALVEDMPVDKVHVLAEGRIVRTGGPELIGQITRQGFAAVAGQENTAEGGGAQ